MPLSCRHPTMPLSARHAAPLSGRWSHRILLWSVSQQVAPGPEGAAHAEPQTPTSAVVGAGDIATLEKEAHPTMHIRSFHSSDLPALVDLTIEVFGPFFEQSFRAMVPPEVYEHQHGDWAADYRESVPKLH